jgi:hypothetical protein
VFGVSAHHPGTHWVGHSVIGSGLGVCFPYLGMVSQTKVIIKAPNQMLLAIEHHVRMYLPLQARERKIPVRPFLMLPYRAAHVFIYFIKQIQIANPLMLTEYYCKYIYKTGAIKRYYFL